MERDKNHGCEFTSYQPIKEAYAIEFLKWSSYAGYSAIGNDMFEANYTDKTFNTKELHDIYIEVMEEQEKHKKG